MKVEQKPQYPSGIPENKPKTAAISILAKACFLDEMAIFSQC
jgi:hypothetical protein